MLSRDFPADDEPLALNDGLFQLQSQPAHVAGELVDGVLLDEPDAGFGIRQTESLPVVHRAGPDRRNGPELRMLGIDQLLASRQKLAFRSE